MLECPCYFFPQSVIKFLKHKNHHSATRAGLLHNVQNLSPTARVRVVKKVVDNPDTGITVSLPPCLLRFEFCWLSIVQFFLASCVSVGGAHVCCAHAVQQELRSLVISSHPPPKDDSGEPPHMGQQLGARVDPRIYQVSTMLHSATTLQLHFPRWFQSWI